MNLNFLDPSKLPDRIDSTLVIPRMLHPPMPERHDAAATKGPSEKERSDSKKSCTNEVVVSEDKMKIPRKKPKLFQKKISLNLKEPGHSGGDCENQDDVSIDVKQDDNDSTEQQKQQPNESETKEAKMDIDQSVTTCDTARNQKGTTEHETDNNKIPPKKKKRPKDNKPSATKEDLHATAWTACYSVSFNRNGTYLASGHASGLIPVHSFMSRCLNAVYKPPVSVEVSSGKKGEKDETKTNDTVSMPIEHVNGTTSLSWDKTGRYLLAGTYGDTMLRWMDNSHPSVAWECAEVTRNVANSEQQSSSTGKTNTGEGEVSLADRILKDGTQDPTKIVYLRNCTGIQDIPFHLKVKSIGKGRLLKSQQPFSFSIHHRPSFSNTSKVEPPLITVPCIRHPYILFQLPNPLAGPIHLHPTQDHIGLAPLSNGLVLFYIPPMAFYEMIPDEATSSDYHVERAFVYHRVDMEVCYLLQEEEDHMAGNIVYLIPPEEEKQYCVTCAVFGKDGMVYAVTKCGTLLGFEVSGAMIHELQGKGECKDGHVEPTFVVKIPGGATATQLVVTEGYVLINSTDCALRLYAIDELKTNADDVVPKFVFQDLVSKAPWVSCDFSADGEYVVGGCNSLPQPGDNYQLFIWNTVTGELLDQLTGPQVSLYCLSCHPTRPFIAVGSSDGIVDIWGYRTDWIAYAPDFQALQQNVLYEEREDEFDIVVDGDGQEVRNGDASEQPSLEDEDVDIITRIEGLPSQGDNSNDHHFYFNTRVLKMLPDKPTRKPSEHD